MEHRALAFLRSRPLFLDLQRCFGFTLILFSQTILLYMRSLLIVMGGSL